MKNYIKFILAIVISGLAGVLGSVFTTPSIPTWYASLAKPVLNPPAWVFGPVWTVLYFLIGLALYLVWKNNLQVANPLLIKAGKPWNKWSERLWTGDWQKANVVAVFAVQYVLNIAWSFVFFGLHNPWVAFFVILALWCSIVYLMVNFYRISKPAAWLLVPYIIWVSFAAYLNYAIATLN